MNRLLIPLLFCMNIIAIDNIPAPTRAIEISKTSLAQYQKDMDSFIDTKRTQNKQLTGLPNGGFFAFLIENVFAPLFSTYGSVNIEEAKVFLGRSFENEELLKKAIKEVPNNKITIDYLATIFTQAEGDVLNKKDGVRFLEIIKNTKYPKLENPKCMGEKDPHGKYVIGDNAFYDYSAATFMAFHIFENHVISLKHHRKA